MRAALVLLIWCLSVVSKAEQSSMQTAKNVILFIGDGMGMAAMTGGRIWAHGSSGQLQMEKFPYVGFAKTFSSSDYVTDSAAAATALATGIKTYNGAIGVTDPQHDPSRSSRPLESLVDVAKKMGKSVGIVTTTRVTHATPAGFYAHVAHRNEEEEIAKAIPISKLDLLMGGGRSVLNAVDHLYDQLVQQNWVVLEEKRHLQYQLGSKKVLGLFSLDHMAYDLEKKSESQEPSLEQMTAYAIEKLSQNPNGYFLMVEGGRIDHAAHENDAKNLFGELIAFDRTIGRAYEYDHQQTLIVVTADHETGGLALNGYRKREGTQGDVLLGTNDAMKDNYFLVSFASGPGQHHDDLSKHPSLYDLEVAAHTAVDVAVFSVGPRAQMFSGFMNNDDIPWRVAEAMGASFQNKVNLINHKIYEK